MKLENLKEYPYFKKFNSPYYLMSYIEYIPTIMHTIHVFLGFVRLGSGQLHTYFSVVSLALR